MRSNLLGLTHFLLCIGSLWCLVHKDYNVDVKVWRNEETAGITTHTAHIYLSLD